MKYSIEYLKHHKTSLQKMVDDGSETEQDREWWAKIVTELDNAIERLSLFSVVGQSEQLTCPRCKSVNCLLPDKENDAECNDCGWIWAG